MLTEKTGKPDNDKCDLCGEKETKDHIWHCKKLEAKRRQVDVEIAEADPEYFTPAMRMGVACALNADPRRTYWGWHAKRRGARRRSGDTDASTKESLVRKSGI